METATRVQADLEAVDAELQAVQSQLSSDPTNLLLDAKRDKLKAELEWLRAKCLAWEKQGATPRTVAEDPDVEKRWSAFQKRSDTYDTLLQRSLPSSASAPAGPQGNFFKICGAFEVKGEMSTFREMLNRHFEKRAIFPHGTCEREGRKITIDFLTTNTDGVLLALRDVLTQFEEEFAGADTVKSIMERLTPAHAPGVDPTNAGPLWTYTRQETSPARLARPLIPGEKRSWDGAPADWLNSPQKRSKSGSELSEQQNAHVLFVYNKGSLTCGAYGDVMRAMLKEVVADENHVEETLKPLLGLTFGLVSFDHSLYDGFFFYFAWHKTPSMLLLSPRVTDLFVGTDLNLDICSVVHLDLPEGQLWETWRRALVLRKYLTLFEVARQANPREPKVPLEQFKDEWNAEQAGESACWKGIKK